MKKMKKIFSILFTLCLTFLFTFSGTSVLAKENATTSNYDNYTPKDYIEWLESKSLNDPNSVNILNKFKSLTKQKQEEFIKYLKDPNLLKNMIESINQKEFNNENTSIKFENGNAEVNISDKSNTVVPNGRAAVKYHSITRESESKLLGIAVVETSHSMNYTSIGSKAGSVTSSSHYVKYNYYPFLTLDWGDTTNATYGSQALSSRPLNYKFNLVGNPTVGTRVFKLWGDIYGGGRLEIE